jgi:cell division protein FtsB
MMYLKLILLFAVISAIGGGYAYHTTTVAKYQATVSKLEANNKTLKDNNVTLTEVAEKNAQAIKNMEAQQVQERAQILELSNRAQALEAEKKNFMKIFKDHNLTRLARAKPGMIETRMNAKTEEVFRLLEEDSKEVETADER